MTFISIYFWQWWILGIILVLIGLARPGTFLPWVGGAAALTGLIVWPFSDIQVGIQLFIFVILAIIAIILWGKKFKHKTRSRRK